MRDEELVAPEHEPGRPAAGEARAAGALHDVERGGEQHVAAEGEDHRRGVQRPQAAEAGPRQVEVERREGELPGEQVADQEAGDAPEDGGDGGDLDRAVHVARRAVVVRSRPLSPKEPFRTTMAAMTPAARNSRPWKAKAGSCDPISRTRPIAAASAAPATAMASANAARSSSPLAAIELDLPRAASRKNRPQASWARALVPYWSRTCVDSDQGDERPPRRQSVAP